MEQTPPMSDPLEAANLLKLSALTEGNSAIRIALLDGPVAAGHPDLTYEHIEFLPRAPVADPSGLLPDGTSHGTVMASILLARRTGLAPGICPGCTLLVRPIFGATSRNSSSSVSATVDELASAILDIADQNAHIINLSVGYERVAWGSHSGLTDALGYAASRGTLVVAAAGNQGTIASTPLLRHPWVLPVVGADQSSHPLPTSTLGLTVGRRGVRAPGFWFSSADTHAQPAVIGSSVATAIVTGALALCLSLLPDFSGPFLRSCVMNLGGRRSVLPPKFDAWTLYQVASSAIGHRGRSPKEA